MRNLQRSVCLLQKAALHLYRNWCQGNIAKKASQVQLSGAWHDALVAGLMNELLSVTRLFCWSITQLHVINQVPHSRQRRHYRA